MHLRRQLLVQLLTVAVMLCTEEISCYQFQFVLLCKLVDLEAPARPAWRKNMDINLFHLSGDMVCSTHKYFDLGPHPTLSSAQQVLIIVMTD